MPLHKTFPESSSQEIGQLDWPLLVRRRTSKRLRNGLKLLLLGLLVVVVLFTFFNVDKEALQSVAEWLDSHRSRSGMALFCSMCMIGVVFIIPGPLLAIISGYLYGKVLGTILVWVSCSIGQSLTYFLGRFLLRDWVVELASKYVSKFQIIDTAIEREGWKLVLLLRLSPLIPDSLLNYILSVTSIKYICYAWSSSLAILPWSLIFAYFGSMGKSIAEAAEGGLHMSSSQMLFWSIASVGTLVLLAWYVAKISRKALADALDDQRS